MTDTRGDVNSFGLIGGGGFSQGLSPTTRRLAAGTLAEYVSTWLTAPASGPSAPEIAPDLYSGIFQNTSGLIGSQHFALPAASLATVHAVYASDAATTGGVSLFAFTSAEFSGGGVIGLTTPVGVPALVTEHLLAGPGIYWQNRYYQSESTLGGGQSDVLRSFAAGSVTTQDWNVYPLNTPLAADVASTGPSVGGFSFFGAPLSATRVGRELALNVTPFTDDTAGHTGTGYAQGMFGSIGSISGSYVIGDNAAKVAAGKITPSEFFGSFNDVVQLPAAPSTVSFTLRAKRTGPLFPLSTGVTDTWTWRSASTPVVSVPSGWYCAGGSTACAVQPLLTFGYQVAHIALDGTAPAGTQEVQINVGHQALVPSPPAVTKVTAQYSTDGGASWQPASVWGSGGTWYASFSAPSGSYVSLRVSATDAASGALTETITRAFDTATEVAAVVEAYDTPKLETYLNVYRKQFGLGPCTVKNGCFRKVGQTGSARHLPASGVLSGWDLEATLDVDMVAAACPTCRILVVEANGQAFNQLAAAEDTAARLGAVAISNSYGMRETGFAQSYAKAYNHPGHAIVVSAGDFGFTAASFPANLATVTSVGGTVLARAKDKRGWSETVWNEFGAGAGASGCSAYVAKPSWQHDKDCQGRTVADVSALAWNVAIYNKNWGGWALVGGTSASSPIVAGIYGLAGNAAKVRPSYEYAHVNALFDVTKGNNDWFFVGNGAACGNDYLCVAKKGYDAPTGLGTPDGIGAF